MSSGGLHLRIDSNWVLKTKGYNTCFLLNLIHLESILHNDMDSNYIFMKA